MSIYSGSDDMSFNPSPDEVELAASLSIKLIGLSPDGSVCWSAGRPQDDRASFPQQGLLLSFQRSSREGATLVFIEDGETVYLKAAASSWREVLVPRERDIERLAELLGGAQD